MKTAVENIQQQESNIILNAFNKQVEQFDKNSYGMMGFYLTLQSCLGGIAVMYLLQSYVAMWVLMPCAIITMMCNALLISQASTKWSVALFNISILVNTFYIIAFNI